MSFKKKLKSILDVFGISQIRLIKAFTLFLLEARTVVTRPAKQKAEHEIPGIFAVVAFSFETSLQGPVFKKISLFRK